ncbi:MAG TPA: GNAT family N-acetyltransferase [Sphingomonas sp.]|jgi:RimJ/RimL family protein N-acetyltransferase
MIETDRLVLSRPTLADLDDSVAMTGEAAVMAFIGGKPLTREEAWNKLLRNIGHWDAFDYGLFTVRERVGGNFVGEIGLAHFARGFGDAFDPFPEGAWILARAGHGHGYASEAVTAAHDWMARTHDAARTVCIIDPANTASMRVAVKLGYVPFGEVEYRGGRPVMLGRG